MTIEDEALARVVGYHDTAPEFDRIRNLTRAISGLRLEQRAVQAKERYEGLLRSTSDPRELLEARRAMTAASVDNIAAAEVKSELDRYRLTVKGEADALGDDAVAPALEWLHERLGALLAGVRSLDETLGSIRTVDAALRGSEEQIIAWRQLDDAVRQYEEIRRAQKLISTKVAGRDAVRDASFYRLFEKHGLMRAAFDVEDVYFDERKPHRGLGWTDGHARRWSEWRRDIPLMRQERRMREVWPEKVAPHDHLRRLAREGGAWVPTLAQLDEAGRAVEQMLRQLTNLDDLRLALAAHDRYFRARGITPRVPLDTDAYRAELPDLRRRGGRRVDDPVQTDPRILAITGE